MGHAVCRCSPHRSFRGGRRHHITSSPSSNRGELRDLEFLHRRNASVDRRLSHIFRQIPFISAFWPRAVVENTHDSARQVSAFTRASSKVLSSHTVLRRLLARDYSLKLASLTCDPR